MWGSLPDDSLKSRTVEPLVIWDPFCGDGSLLQRCLDLIFNIPSNPIARPLKTSTSLPLVQLFDVQGESWFSSLKYLWDPVASAKTTAFLSEYVCAIGSDSRVQAQKNGCIRWKWWMDQNSTLSFGCKSETSNIAPFMRSVDWGGLVNSHSPVLLTTNICSIASVDQEAPTVQNAVKNSLQRAVESNTAWEAAKSGAHSDDDDDLVVVSSRLRLGIFSTLSPESIASRLERPFLITEFPGSADLLRARNDSKKKFQANVDLFDRLLTGGGPWRQVIVLARTKSFSTRSKLQWTDLGKCLGYNGETYHLLEWKNGYKSAWRASVVDLLEQIEDYDNY